LAHRIPRIKIKGGGPRKSAKPAEEPRFYSKPYLSANDASSTRKDKSAAYHMYAGPTTTTDASATAIFGWMEQQALAKQASLSLLQKPKSVAGVVTPAVPYQMSFVPAAAVGSTSFSNVLSMAAFQQQSMADAGIANPNVWAAMRQNDLLTAAVLQHLRR
jgi:hypothetical protein